MDDEREGELIHFSTRICGEFRNIVIHTLDDTLGANRHVLGAILISIVVRLYKLCSVYRTTEALPPVSYIIIVCAAS